MSKKVCGRSSDIIEIRLSDNTYNTYFKDKAKINSASEMENLFTNLKNSGVDVLDFVKKGKKPTWW